MLDDPDFEPPSGERATLPPEMDLEELARSRFAPHDDESGARPLAHRALIAELGDRYANADYEGALALAEVVDPRDEAYAVAQFCAERCRATLEAIYAERIGGYGHVLRIVVDAAQLRSARIDHRAGFIASLIDGRTGVEEVVDASGMSKFDALRILDLLVERGIAR
jgi:hypothetical protein